MATAQVNSLALHARHSSGMKKNNRRNQVGAKAPQKDLETP